MILTCSYFSAKEATCSHGFKFSFNELENHSEVAVSKVEVAKVQLMCIFFMQNQFFFVFFCQVNCLVLLKI